MSKDKAQSLSERSTHMSTRQEHEPIIDSILSDENRIPDVSLSRRTVAEVQTVRYRATMWGIGH